MWFERSHTCHVGQLKFLVLFCPEPTQKKPPGQGVSSEALRPSASSCSGPWPAGRQNVLAACWTNSASPCLPLIGPCQSTIIFCCHFKGQETQNLCCFSSCPLGSVRRHLCLAAVPSVGTGARLCYSHNFCLVVWTLALLVTCVTSDFNCLLCP